VVSVSDVFDMQEPAERMAILAASLNMYRVLVALKSLLPARPVKIFSKIPRRDGGSVEISGDKVVKLTRQRAPKELYDLLKDGRIPCSIKVTDTAVKSDMLRVTMEPACAEKTPTSLAELKTAVSHVLCALEALHSHGFVHRDIRWPNVLTAPDGRWLLIDFELAGKVGDASAATGAKVEDEIKPEYLPPEVKAGKDYGPQGDIFRVGRLITESGVGLDADARAFARDLTEERAECRPSAANARKNAWLEW
jgi:serine/threonine protein kinase